MNTSIIIFLMLLAGIFMIFFLTNESKVKRNIKKFSSKKNKKVSIRFKIILLIKNFLISKKLYSDFEKEKYKNALRLGSNASKNSEVNSTYDINGKIEEELEKNSYEFFLAEIIFNTLLMLLLSLFIFAFLPLIAILLIVVTITYLLTAYKKPLVDHKKSIKLIENELPKLLNFLTMSFKNSRDIYSILLAFKEGTIREFKEELEITLIDIKSSNIESALLNLENRISSKNLKEITRTLIGISNGDTDLSYLTILNYEFKKEHINNLKLRSINQPKKFNKFSMLLLLSFIATYFVIFSLYILNMTRQIF